jgi:hypothetical protein
MFNIRRKNMKLNKKAQSGDIIGQYAAKVFFFGLVVFGIIQLFAFLAPQFGIKLDEIVTKNFGGGVVIFLFIAAGLVGLALNEVLTRVAANYQPIFDSRIAAFIVTGILVGVFAWVFGSLADAGLIGSNVAKAMLLP